MEFLPVCKNMVYTNFIRAMLFNSDSVIQILLDENVCVCTQIQLFSKFLLLGHLMLLKILRTPVRFFVVSSFLFPFLFLFSSFPLGLPNQYLFSGR